MKSEEVEKLVGNLHDKTEYVLNVRNLKQALNNGFVLKQVHRVIRFNQNPCLKLYIDMNTNLRKKGKNDFEKDFFKLMNNAVFGKTMKIWENMEIWYLPQQEKEETIFTENLLAIEMKKT